MAGFSSNLNHTRTILTCIIIMYALGASSFEKFGTIFNFAIPVVTIRCNTLRLTLVTQFSADKARLFDNELLSSNLSRTTRGFLFS